MKKSGRVLMTAELGKEYGLEDVDGMRCLNIFVLLSQIKSKECVNFKMFKRNIIIIKMFHIKKSQARILKCTGAFITNIATCRKFNLTYGKSR